MRLCKFSFTIISSLLCLHTFLACHPYIFNVFKFFCIYCALAPSLHRESTNSLIEKRYNPIYSKYKRTVTRLPLQSVNVLLWFSAATLLPLLALEAIKYHETGLLVLNQLLLPGETHYEEIKSVRDGIKTMKVQQFTV